MEVDLKALFAKLNPYCTKALEASAGACVARSGYEVTIEDFLLRVTEGSDGDVPVILRHYGLDISDLRKLLHHEVEQMNTGNPGKPVFSPLLVGLFRDGWLLASTDFGLDSMQSGVILTTLVKRPLLSLGSYGELLDAIPADDLVRNYREILSDSRESGAGEPGSDSLPLSGDSALAKYATDFTEQARKGELDPVLCRDSEIRQMIDILSRRRKNNPIVVGDAGVGKTAVIEGLAIKIVEGKVPASVKDASILGLDLGLLQAGASVKGEFEKRLQDVIAEVRASSNRIILFIDEAHMLIGSGGQAGSSDAANLLKPALARGELHAIAATTWSEYKKFFEKDHALERRFQIVKLDEPRVSDAVTILRGLRSRYEDAHNVYVRDDAIMTAASLSARYISGRQLPDKAVDVLDTACARVGVALTATPYVIEDKEHTIQILMRERDALLRDMRVRGETDESFVKPLDQQIENRKQALTVLTGQWTAEKTVVDQLLDCRREIRNHQTGEEDIAAIREKIEGCLTELRGLLQHEASLVPYEVSPELVSKVISDWTGIPLGKILRDEAAVLNDFTTHIRKWIKGQEHAVSAIGDGIRTAKSGLGNPDTPMGVFLLVGPSGVGKTETATAVSELLFGGRHALITVNMSEFQEKHTISRLIGSPPGYVGYGEGGVLTEAVRQRPYSVVLLDEVEKAAVDVLNLFYQVFDKGVLSDGEGREIDFRNTVMFLTSNFSSELISDACRRNSGISADEVKTLIRPSLTSHFKAALLARMEVIPYLPLEEHILGEIIQSKLEKVADRLRETRDMALCYGQDLKDFIARKCVVSDSGARNIDHTINRFLLPELSAAVLDQKEENNQAMKIEVGEEDQLIVLKSPPGITHQPH